MGMSSSQARLLNLTARMHQIEYKAAKLEAQKLQMANESRRVYENYLNALDARKIQYKFIKADGALDYKDATLASLENGAVSSYAGDTSDNIYLLYDNTDNDIPPVTILIVSIAMALSVTGGGCVAARCRTDSEPCCPPSCQ